MQLHELLFFILFLLFSLGDYKDDKKNGKGIFTWSDGDKYEGIIINL